MRFALLALAVVPALAASGTGFDISGAASVANIQCMMTANYSSVVVRAFRSTGTVDTNAKQSLINAHTAGIAHIDIYMFPCPTCSASASSQFNTMISNLATTTFGIAWLDIEEDTVGQYWSTNFATNQAWYLALVNACIAAGVKCGVYSNYNNWVRIFGSSTFQISGGTNLPMWYASYNGVKSYADYTAFGGWTTPAMKQYAAPTSLVCSMGIDQSWFANENAWTPTGPPTPAPPTPAPTPLPTNSGNTCTLPSGAQGGCVTTTACAAVNGVSTPGYCKGASNIQCCTPVTCTFSSSPGVCMPTTMCAADEGTTHAGLCPGASNIQCCVETSCTAGGVSGKCMDTASCTAFGGTSTSGLCPGASNIQCCTKAPGTGGYEVGGNTTISASGRTGLGSVVLLLSLALVLAL